MTRHHIDGPNHVTDFRATQFVYPEQGTLAGEKTHVGALRRIRQKAEIPGELAVLRGEEISAERFGLVQKGQRVSR
jgi:hypothetical protein